MSDLMPRGSGELRLNAYRMIPLRYLLGETEEFVVSARVTKYTPVLFQKDLCNQYHGELVRSSWCAQVDTVRYTAGFMAALPP